MKNSSKNGQKVHKDLRNLRNGGLKKKKSIQKTYMKIQLENGNKIPYKELGRKFMKITKIEN